MQPILFLDIDHTIFDTHAFMNRFVRPAFAEYIGIDLATLSKEEAHYKDRLEKSTDFDPDVYTATIAQQFTCDGDALRGIFFTPAWYQSAMYSEVREALKALAHQCTLGIYSEGVATFQMRKLQLGGIVDWFAPDKIIIERRKDAPEVLAKLPIDAFFVDDRVEYLHALKAAGIGKGIHIVRDNHLDTTHEFQRISTLNELQPIFESNEQTMQI